MQTNLRLAALFMMLLLSRQAISQTTVSFPYSGTTPTWTVPPGVTTVTVDVMGASGGNYYSSTGGCGGEVNCVLAVTPGQVLSLNVGGVGGDGSYFTSGAGGQSGANPSGGNGGVTLFSGAGGGGGGGASDIRIGGTVMVIAGAGGGAGDYFCGSENGGAGGGSGTAGDGVVCGGYNSTYCGAGASPTVPGAGATGVGYGGGTTGSSLLGGDGAEDVYLFVISFTSSIFSSISYTNYAGGGGGGGYYGGGGGTEGGGGGGSSYTDPVIASSVVHTSGSSCTDGSITLTYICIPPVGGAITGLSSVCAGSSITLSDLTGTSGGTWTSSDITIATAGSSTGLITGVAGGVVTITYTLSSPCGSATATAPVTVNPLPVAGSITGTLSACIGSTTPLADGAPGGVWSSVSTGIATVGTSGIVTGVAAGTSTISYTVTNGCGVAAATAVVTINTFPAAGTITGTPIVCAGATTPLADAAGGGTWSSISTGIATISPAGLVTGVTAGTSLISYTVSNACGSAAATTIVTVNPLPVTGSISGSLSVCMGGTSPLADPAPGGSWSSVSTGVATINAITGLVSGVSLGTSTISYTVTNSCGTAAATAIVTVDVAPTGGTITGTPRLCASGTTLLSDGTPGGVWSSGSTGVATINPAGLVSGVAGGTTLISYTVTNGCGSATATMIVSVDPLPGPGSISGTLLTCVTATTALTDPAPGGVWSSVSTGVASVGTSGVVTGVASGTSTISYTVTNSCGSAAASVVVTVTPAPSVGVITGADSVCVTALTVLSDVAPGGTWSSTATGIATISSTGDVIGVARGITTISYSITSACGTVATSMTVTVMAAPAAGSVTGPAAVCVGTTASLTPTVPGGLWNAVNGNASVTVAGGLVSGLTVGLDTIFYTVSNSCGSGIVNYPLSVITIPVVTPVSGPSSVCVGGNIALGDGTPGGTWTSGSAAATVSSAGVVTGASTGVVNLTYTVSNACGTVSSSKFVTVDAVPDAGILSGDTVYCLDSVKAIIASIGGGTWSIKNGNAYVDAMGNVGGVHIGLDTVIYTVTNPCGTASVQFPITVSPLGICNTNSVPTVNAANRALYIHPNPNDGSFTLLLSTANEEQVEVVITDVLGSKVKSFITTTNKNTDIKLDAAAGIYFVSAYTNGSQYTAKIVVAK